MKYLLDTHTFLWALQDSPSLSFSVRDLIVDNNNDIYVSIVSLWEIAIKNRKYPNLFPYDIKTIVDYAIGAGYIFLSLSIDNVLSFSKFDFGTHKDPFDQMLISQSISSKMKIITHDEIIAKIIPQNTIYF